MENDQKQFEMKNPGFLRSLVIISAGLNTVIFALLSILHFYWALGGKLWYDEVLPTTSNGLSKLNPSPTAGVVVAFGLLLLALITLGTQGLFDRHIKRSYFRFGILAIAILFLVRAIGDFKFIGFFKTVKLTSFGINDTQIFSPLCLFISLLSILIFIFNRKSGRQK